MLYYDEESIKLIAAFRVTFNKSEKRREQNVRVTKTRVKKL